MTSTKLEIHNLLHCRLTRTDPWPQLTCTENFVKLGHVVFENASGQTYGHAHGNTARPYGGKVTITEMPVDVTSADMQGEVSGVMCHL